MKAIKPDNKYVSGPIFTLKAKTSNQLVMEYQIIGTAIINANTTNLANCMVSSNIIFATDAPNTFLIPISLVLFPAVKAARPNSPTQAMMIASMAKIPNILPDVCSDLY